MYLNQSCNVINKLDVSLVSSAAIATNVHATALPATETHSPNHKRRVEILRIVQNITLQPPSLMKLIGAAER